MDCRIARVLFVEQVSRRRNEAVREGVVRCRSTCWFWTPGNLGARIRPQDRRDAPSGRQPKVTSRRRLMPPLRRTDPSGRVDRSSADEHAQTSVSEHGDRHFPRPAGIQAAAKQHAGLLELDAQPSADRIRLPEGAARKVSASVRRACIPDTYAASGPNREPGRILIPGDGAAGDQGFRIGLPARQWRLRDACGLSRLNDLLALWPRAHAPSYNRHVTSTSIHMAKPGSASALTTNVHRIG